MDKIYYLDKYLRPKVIHRGLLPPMIDNNIEGKTRVKIICSYVSKLFGKYGWTDFVEIEPGYVIMYFPKLGFVDLYKDTYVID